MNKSSAIAEMAVQFVNRCCA